MSLRRLAAALPAVAAFVLGCASTRPNAMRARALGDPDTMPAPAMYATLCAHCHGRDAAGYAADHAPSLVNPTFLESARDEYLEHSIEQGRPGTSMAAYSRSVGGPLGSDAIRRLVAWIRGHGPAPRELAPVGAGDAARGGASYAANCQRCHGDLARRGEDVMLANSGFLAEASDAFLQHAIRNGRPGTPMVAFATTLDTTRIADIVAYLRSLARPVEAARLQAPTGREPLCEFPHGRRPEFAIKDGRFVGVEQVARALKQRRKLVIADARPASEWMMVHITGAISMPHYKLERLDEIPGDAFVVAYCACPHHLSGIVVDSLRAHGRANAYVLDEGILEWERRGYPIVAAPGAPLPPLEASSSGHPNP